MESANSYRTFAFHNPAKSKEYCSLLILLFILSACRCSDANKPEILFTTSLANFSVTVEAEGELQAKKSHVLITPDVWPNPKISYLIPEGTQVQKDDMVVKFESEEIAREYQNEVEAAQIVKAEAKRTEAELSLQRMILESQMQSAQASAATVRLQLPSLEFMAQNIQEIKKLEMQKFEAEAEKLRKKLSSLESIEKEERANQLAKVKQSENKVSRSQIFLDRLVLKAPVAGIVVYEMNWATDKKVQEGDAVWNGMPVVKIPDLTVMQVQLQLGETAAQKLKIGQKAVISVPSVGDFRLTGKVTRVASVAKPIKRGSKVKQVEAIVEIDSTRAGLVPGLTANCIISVEEKANVLAVPLECLFEKDSSKAVYVLNGSHFRPRKVKLSFQNTNYAVIDSGLTVGEKLAMREPGSSLVRESEGRSKE